jgi:hypothetical protein
MKTAPEQHSGSSKNQVGNSSKGYVRNTVAADGDCGYTSYGIKREGAVNLLLAHINDERVLQLLQTDIKELLLIEDFFNHLKCQQIIDSGILFASFSRMADKYSKDSRIVTEYINYVVREKKYEKGWAHPCVLQSLAHIQKIEIYMWQLGDDKRLIPHRDAQRGDYDYASYSPEGANERRDLLYINGNHFERLQFIGFGEDGFPNIDDTEVIYPLEIQKNQHSLPLVHVTPLFEYYRKQNALPQPTDDDASSLESSNSSENCPELWVNLIAVILDKTVSIYKKLSVQNIEGFWVQYEKNPEEVLPLEKIVLFITATRYFYLICQNDLNDIQKTIPETELRKAYFFTFAVHTSPFQLQNYIKPDDTSFEKFELTQLAGPTAREENDGSHRNLNLTAFSSEATTPNIKTPNRS